MTLDLLRSFFGWMSVLSIGYLALATLGLITMQSFAISVHQRLFGLSEDDLRRSYFSWLANCKLIVVFFVLGPYVALVLM